jgi:hypothetical protein
MQIMVTCVYPHLQETVGVGERVATASVKSVDEERTRLIGGPGRSNG